MNSRVRLYLSLMHARRMVPFWRAKAWQWTASPPMATPHVDDWPAYAEGCAEEWSRIAEERTAAYVALAVSTSQSVHSASPRATKPRET
jgi:hypothetical protein